MSAAHEDESTQEAPGRFARTAFGPVRAVRALFGLGAGFGARRHRGRARGERERGVHAPGARDPQERARAARRQGRGRDGAARRHHRAFARHAVERGCSTVPHRRPLAPAGLRRDARRPARHDPHPRFPRSFSPPNPRFGADEGARGRAGERARERERARHAAFGGANPQARPLCARPRCRRSTSC